MADQDREVEERMKLLPDFIESNIPSTRFWDCGWNLCKWTVSVSRLPRRKNSLGMPKKDQAWIQEGENSSFAAR